MKDINDMTKEEFISFICKRKEPKKRYKVTNSWGAYDAYKAIRKNKWFNIGRPLKEHEFYSIIRKVNDYLAEEILEGNVIRFPHRMGNIRICRDKPTLYIEDGKIRNTYPVNWNATLDLWFKDEEARQNKTLVRHMDKDVYKVVYFKREANYENCRFYTMAINRFIRRKLKEKIKKGEVDTLW